MTPHHAERKQRRAQRPQHIPQLPLLWLGVVTGPIAWTLQLGILYPMVAWACERQGTEMLHLASGILFLLSFASAMLSAYYLRLPHHLSRETILTDRIEDLSRREIPSPQFLALSGVVLGLFFMCVIAAQWLPVFLIDPCL